jgi:hypothetical protein
MDLVNKQINISEIVLFKQQKITCFDMQYVQIKSCSDVKIVYKIKILTSAIYADIPHR